MVKAQRAKRVKPMPPVAHSFCWPTAGSWTTKIPTRVAKIIYSTEMETMIPYLSCQQPLHQQRHLAKMTILVHEKIIKKEIASHIYKTYYSILFVGKRKKNFFLVFMVQFSSFFQLGLLLKTRKNVI